MNSIVIHLANYQSAGSYSRERSPPAATAGRTPQPSTPSSTSVSISANGQILANNELHSFEISDRLTKKDLELVNAVTGSLNPVSSGGVRLINTFAQQIALDREVGWLSGEVDKGYIEGLLAAQKEQGFNWISKDVLQRALRFLGAD